MQNINLDKLKKGIFNFSVSKDKKQRAYDNILHWLNDDQFEEYRSQLYDIINNEQYDLLIDSFYQIMPFDLYWWAVQHSGYHRSMSQVILKAACTIPSRCVVNLSLMMEFLYVSESYQ